MQKDKPEASAANMAPDKPPPKGPCCGRLRAMLAEGRARRDMKRAEDERQALAANDPRRDKPHT
jgi:hypothetical protein